MQRFVGFVVVLGLFASPTATGRATAAAMIGEPESGTPFPVVLTPPGGTTPHRLVGTGVRQRTIFRVKVYAFGLYVDPAVTTTALAEFAGTPAAALQRDAGFHRRLLDLDFGMTLRLVMARTVEGGDVADAFDDALRPRMARASERFSTRRCPTQAFMKGADGAGKEVPLARLRSYLDVDEVARGTEIVFSCDPGGRLTASVGSAPQPPIASRDLCRALFDIYLGQDPIERDGKRNIIAGFARLLALDNGAANRQ